RQAPEGLRALIAGMNETLGGQHLFGGINADRPPIADYFAVPASAGKQALDGAFLASFGTTQAGPGAAAITAAEMRTFLDSPFAAMFQDPQWSDWSAASSRTLQSRISATAIVETSVSANEPGVRKLAMAYAMIADLG